MKSRLFILLFVLCALSVAGYADDKCDIIVTQAGQKIEANIQEVQTDVIKYIQPNANTLEVVPLEKIAFVIYKNGEVRLFNHLVKNSSNSLEVEKNQQTKTTNHTPKYRLLRNYPNVVKQYNDEDVRIAVDLTSNDKNTISFNVYLLPKKLDLIFSPQNMHVYAYRTTNYSDEEVQEQELALVGFDSVKLQQNSIYSIVIDSQYKKCSQVKVRISVFHKQYDFLFNLK